MSSRKKRRVAVLYTHALFGQAIAQLLEADEQLAVTCLKARLSDTTERLKEMKPHAIVVAGREQDELLFSALRELPATLFIGLHIEDNLMEIYRRRQILTASPEALLQVVHPVRGGQPPAAAGRG